MIYLATKLLGYTAQLQRIGLVRNELEWTRKEALVLYFQALSWHILGGP